MGQSLDCPFLCHISIHSLIAILLGGDIMDYDLIYDIFIQIIHRLLEQEQKEDTDEKTDHTLC